MKRRKIEYVEYSRSETDMSLPHKKIIKIFQKRESVLYHM